MPKTQKSVSQSADRKKIGRRNLSTENQKSVSVWKKSVDPSARRGPGDVEGDVDVVHLGLIVFKEEFLFHYWDCGDQNTVTANLDIGWWSLSSLCRDGRCSVCLLCGNDTPRLVTVSAQILGGGSKQQASFHSRLKSRFLCWKYFAVFLVRFEYYESDWRAEEAVRII